VYLKYNRFIIQVKIKTKSSKK